MKESPKQRAYEKALAFFRTEIVESNIIKTKGRVLQPIPIQNAEKNLAAWLIPIAVQDRIVGYFQFNTSLEFLRYASFQRNPENIENCPKVDDWLDSEKIKERAKKLATNDEKLSKPYLTYETDLSRIIWAVLATKPNGQKRRIFVIGDTAYIERDRKIPFTG